MSEQQGFQISLAHVSEYEFTVRFDGTGLAPLATDEPAPLGTDAGPNPARLLLVSVANCLAASLLFSLKKFRNEASGIRATARAHMVRNAARRWRIEGIDVELHLGQAADELAHLERALAQFEDFCVVTQSVRDGIPVALTVSDATGRILHANAAHS